MDRIVKCECGLEFIIAEDTDGIITCPNCRRSSYDVECSGFDYATESGIEEVRASFGEDATFTTSSFDRFGGYFYGFSDNTGELLDVYFFDGYEARHFASANGLEIVQFRYRSVSKELRERARQNASMAKNNLAVPQNNPSNAVPQSPNPELPVTDKPCCPGESLEQRLNRLLEAKKGNSAIDSLEASISELDALIGLPAAKAEMKRLTDFLRVQAERRKHGLRDPGQTLHFVFKGNPGTGKTTVARIVGRLLHGFGFLKTDNFVECSRSDLVGGYLGQTALKTDEKLRQALDGVLFVDEAYTLARERDDDSYGHEAIDTLLKRMEDFRDRLTVIVAGYPRLMDKFMNSNPGLKSRFTRFLHFEDYTADELIRIFEKFCNDSHYVPDVNCRQAVSSLFNLAYRERDETFGNARYVRNVFEDVVNRHSQRLTASGSLSNLVELMRLDALDVPLYETLIGLGKRRGFVSQGQVIAVLPKDCTDEQIQALFDLLEAHGVEVLSDEEAASRTRQAATTESRSSELPD